MKYCSKCGNKLSDSMNFCNKCGNKIKENSPINNDENSKEEPIINLPSINKDIPTKNINNTTKLNSKDIKENSSNNTYDCNFHSDEDFNFDDTKDCNFDDDEDFHFEYKDKEIKTNSKKKKVLIGVISFLVIVLIGISIYFLKDPILYKYHYNSALKSSSTSEKISEYNKALEYECNDEIIDSIYNTLKLDSDFLNDSSELTNLDKESKNKLLSKLYVFKANDDFKNGNYEDCSTDLDLATRYGYNRKDFDYYDELVKKLKPKKTQNNVKVDNTYSYKNNNPAKFSGNIYDYPYDYIMPDSDSTYLSASDLSQYNKSTLALIRNEIYARHGYVFNTEPFKSYFNSKSWYTPDPSFKGNDSELNNYEIQNVRTIQSVEKSK